MDSTNDDLRYAWDAYKGDTRVLDCAESIRRTRLEDLTHWEMDSQKRNQKQLTVSYWARFKKSQPRHSPEYKSSIRLLAKTLIHMRWFVIYCTLETMLRDKFKEKHGVVPASNWIEHPDQYGTILLIAEGIIGEAGITHIINKCYDPDSTAEEIKMYQTIKDVRNSTYYALRREYWYAPKGQAIENISPTRTTPKQEDTPEAKKARTERQEFYDRLDKAYAKDLLQPEEKDKEWDEILKAFNTKDAPCESKSE